MIYLLLFVLVLTHRQTQLVRAIYSAALPLSVRSPYFSCWLPQLNISDPLVPINNSYGETTTSNLSQYYHQDIYVRVDGVAFSIIGRSRLFKPDNKDITDPGIANRVITPTQTTYIAQAGPIQVNVSFFNPVEPGDWVRQSIPFSYLSITAKSLDGSAHKIEVYSDIGPYWVTTNYPMASDVMLWNVTSKDEVVYHTATYLQPVSFSEDISQAGWGTFYYGTKADKNVTYKISDVDTAIAMFVNDGVLDNGGAVPTDPFEPSWIVFAISHDLGIIQATQDPVVFVLGYTTDPAISYPAQSGIPAQQLERSPYYKLKYSDDESLIVDFLNDFGNASKRALQLDQKILQDAASISDRLGDLVSLAVPQVFGSTQLTIGKDANGGFNKSDVMMFMKNIGGDSESGDGPNRVNAVETLYEAFPALMYIDSSLGAPLLEPLFQLQDSTGSGVGFAVSDLGGTYPNVSVPNPESTRSMGVEQSGNMLIMTYAHALASGNGNLINRYYHLLASWADYLCNWTLYNDFDTNLAIKGIIAIGAMSNMSSVVGRIADAKHYSDLSTSLYTQWKKFALDSDNHIQEMYNVSNSWTLGHNLFADIWLGTKVVEPLVYDGHSAFINNLNITSITVDPSHFDTPQTLFDLPYASFAPWAITVSSWNLFVAAMTPDRDLQSNIIRRAHNRASILGSPSMGIFPVRYSGLNGSDMSGMASPAQGAMFAPLVLKVSPQIIHVDTTTTTPTSTTPPTSTTLPRASHSHAEARAIIGSIMGLLLVVGIVAFILWYRRARHMRTVSAPSSSAMRSVSGIGLTPFIVTHRDATHGDQVSWMGPQQPQSRSPEAVGANADANGPSSSSTDSATSLRLFPHVPIGLSAKMLARMRAETLRPQLPDSPPTLDVSGLRSPSPSVPAIERRAATSPPMFRTVHAQFDRLWREIQQLRAEIFNSEAPPSYGEGNVVEGTQSHE